MIVYNFKIPFIDPKTKKGKVIIKNIGDVSAGAKFGARDFNLTKPMKIELMMIFNPNTHCFFNFIALFLVSI
tara:strand:+ start:120 stop:335 length:216 start_codon:yes stop_codon:yes gene_type:complete